MQFKSLTELFADPGRWCKGSFAKDNKGKMVPSFVPEAVQWCILGGIGSIYGYGSTNANKIIEKLKKLWKLDGNNDYFSGIGVHQDKLTYEQMYENVKRVENELEQNHT